jgi:hypothetical protein
MGAAVAYFSVAQSLQRVGYGLDDRGIAALFLAKASNVSLLHIVQTGSGACPNSCTMGTKGLFRVGNAARS